MGKTIKHLLREDGYLYIFESHPFFMMFDTERLSENITRIKYPYFSKEPDIDEWIGGYASESKGGVEAYFWMHKISDIINSLTLAGLHIECFNEFRENFFDAGGCKSVGNGLYNYDFNEGLEGLFPMSFSLKASVYRK